MVVDRDIDRLMERTKGRPLVTGAMSPRAALTFAIGLEVVAFALLWGTVNLLSAVLAVAACLFYVFVYTLWLKRTSTHNIVIGGAAGAVPVLIGWSSVTGIARLGPGGAVRRSSSTGPRPTSGPWPSATGTTTRPPTCRCSRSVVSLRTHLRRGSSPTRCCSGPSPWPSRRWPAWATSTSGPSIVLGGVFTWFALRLWRMGDPAPATSPSWAAPASSQLRTTAMQTFAWSITYITLLFGAMAARPAPPIGLVSVPLAQPAGSKRAGARD